MPKHKQESDQTLLEGDIMNGYLCSTLKFLFDEEDDTLTMSGTQQRVTCESGDEYPWE